MQDSKILPRQYRREARRNQKALQRAMVTSSGITNYARRRMNRLRWEGDRSPSRLDRMGERATQANAVIVPAAGAASALIGVIVAGMELWERYERFRKRNQTASTEEV